MKYQLILFGTLSFLSTQSFAINVCELLNSPIENESSYPLSAVKNYKEKLKNECRLSTEYKKQVQKAESQKIDHSQISIFQAKRYIRTVDYLDRASRQVPVPLTYQRFKSQYALDTSQQSSEIWQNFLTGVQQLETEKNEILQGKSFKFSDLLRVHKGFYTLSDESGDFSHKPNPGQIKSPVLNDSPWWRLRSENDVQNAKKSLEIINSRYRELQLISAYDDGEGESSEDLVSVKTTVNGSYIFSGETKTNGSRTEKLLQFMNSMIAMGLAGHHMNWNNELMTPAEVAYLVQHFFVGIHPFYEGNGRMSRFLQELVMGIFELPYGASGDLMDIDVLTPLNEYYKIAMEKNFELLEEVEICLNKSSYNILNLTEVEQSLLDYKCKILKN